MSSITSFTEKTQDLDWVVLLSRDADELQKGSEEAEQQLEDIYELIKKARISTNDEYATAPNLVKLFRLVQLAAELKDGYLLGAEDQIKQLDETVAIQEDEIRRLHTLVGGDAALELQHFEEERKVYEAKAELARRKMSEAEERYENEKSRNFELNETLNSIRIEKDKLQAQNNQVISELQQFRNRGLERSLRDREDEERLQSMVKEKTIETTRLQKDLNYIKQEHSKLQQDATNVISELEATVTELENLNKEKKELEELIKTSDTQITQLEKENSSLKNELIQISHAYESKTESRHLETEELKTTITRAVEKAQNWQKQSEEQKVEIRNLQQKIESLKQEYSTSKLDQLRRELRERESLIQSLTEKLDDARNDMELLVKDWQGLQTLVKENATTKIAAAVEASQSQIQALQSKLTLQKTREKRAHSRAKSLRQELDKVENDLLDTQHLLNSVTSEVYGLPDALHEIKVLKRQIILREQDITKWTSRVSDLQSEIDRLREENDAYRDMEYELSDSQPRVKRSSKTHKRKHRKRDSKPSYNFDEEKVEKIEKYVTVLSKPGAKQNSQQRPEIDNPFLEKLVNHIERAEQRWQKTEEILALERDTLVKTQTLNRFLQALVQDLVLCSTSAVSDSNDEEQLSVLKSVIEKITHNEHCFQDIDTSILTAHLTAQTQFISGEQKRLIARVEAALERFLAEKQKLDLETQTLSSLQSWLHQPEVSEFSQIVDVGLEGLQELERIDGMLDTIVAALETKNMEQQVVDRHMETQIQRLSVASQAAEYCAKHYAIGMPKAGTGSSVPASIRLWGKGREERRVECLLHSLNLAEQENEFLKVNFAELEQAYLEVCLKVESYEMEMKRLAATYSKSIDESVSKSDYDDCFQKLCSLTANYSLAVKRQEILLSHLDDTGKEAATLRSLLQEQSPEKTLVNAEYQLLKTDLQGKALSVLSQEELISRLERAHTFNDNIFRKMEIAVGKAKIANDLEVRAKERAAELEKMALDNVDIIYGLQQELTDYRSRYEHGATAAEFEQMQVGLKAEAEQARQWKQKASSYQKMADYAMQQLVVIRGTRRLDSLERDMLKATVQELQMEEDSKCIIGKLHQQIINLKVAEARAVEQYKALKVRALGLESSYRQAQIVATELFGVAQQSEKAKTLLKSRLSIVIDRQRSILIGCVTVSNYDTVLKKWLDAQLASKSFVRLSLAHEAEAFKLKDECERIQERLLAQQQVISAFKANNRNIEPLLCKQMEYSEAKLDNKRLNRKVQSLEAKLEQLQRDFDSNAQSMEELERLHLAAEAKLDDERQKWCKVIDEMPAFDLCAEKLQPWPTKSSSASKEIQIIETVKPDPRVSSLFKDIELLEDKVRHLELNQLAKETQLSQLQEALKLAKSENAKTDRAPADALTDAQRIRRLKSQLSQERKSLHIARQTVKVFQEQLNLHDSATSKMSQDLYKVLQAHVNSSKALSAEARLDANVTEKI